MFSVHGIPSRKLILRLYRLNRDAVYRVNSIIGDCSRVNFNYSATRLQSFISTPSSSQNDREQPKSSNPLSWIDKHVHAAVRPYLKLIRADKQIGTFLLLWPCLWSAALATPLYSLPDILSMEKFVIGALLMRSAGCIINDMFDKDFDKFVERTKDRPLANNTLTIKQASVFLGSLLTCSLGVLLSFNPSTIYLGFAAMPLVIIYPLMKRYTYWPQLSLGLAFNWGSLMGWTAVMGVTNWSVVLPLFAAGVSWTLIYDTIYGHQDKKEDLALGLKSTSILFGEKWTVPALGFFGGIMTTGIIDAYLASNGVINMPFVLGISAAACQLVWQISTLKLDDKKNLNDRFKSNNYLGAIILSSIIAGRFMG